MTEVLCRPGKYQGHADSLSRLPMDKVQFFGQGNTVLQTAEDTAQELELIHKDGHYFRSKENTETFSMEIRRSAGEDTLSSHCLILQGLPARF